MRARALLTAVAMSAAALGGQAGDDWVEPMKAVRARFAGQRGTVAQLGDSITITMAFFVPLQAEIRNLPDDLALAHGWVRSYVQSRCWRGWKGPQYGNEGRTTTKWALAHIDGWLERLNPEVALVMWGTNDTYQGPKPPEYTDNLRTIIQKCLDNGTVPILYTIPPKGSQARSEKERRHVETFVEAARTVAREKHVPLIDFYQAILDRQPTDFATTLLGDNLHPSYPERYRRDFSDDALKHSGYTLRNYLTLLKYHEVYRKVLSQVKSARAVAAAEAWRGPVVNRLPAVLIRRAAQAPKIDGSLDDPCWGEAEVLELRRLDGDPERPRHATSARLAATATHLYVAFHCVEPDRPVGRKRDRDGSIWEDDSVEVFLRPGPEPAGDYAHLIVNPLGSHYDAIGRDAAAWQPAIAVGTTAAKGHWTAEIAIPFAGLKLPGDKAALAGPWRLNLTRMRPARGGEDAEEVALSPTEDRSSHVPARFAYAFFEVFGGKLPKEAHKQ